MKVVHQGSVPCIFQQVSILVARAPVGKGASLTCAVLALQCLFLNDPHHTANSPLFMDGAGSPLSWKSFLSLLKHQLAEIGLNQSLYAGHSFHRGAATSAAAVGYSDYEIQLLGRWCSNAYKLYIDVPTTHVLHLSSLLKVYAARPIARVSTLVRKLYWQISTLLNE